MSPEAAAQRVRVEATPVWFEKWADVVRARIQKFEIVREHLLCASCADVRCR